MAAKLDPYQSTPLRSKTDIRVLTLHKGSGEDPIKCSLTTVNLEQNGGYESLSY
jgi:hypothetical protein